MQLKHKNALSCYAYLLGVAAFQDKAKKLPEAAVGPKKVSSLPGRLSTALLAAKGRVSSALGTKPNLGQQAACSPSTR